MLTTGGTGPAPRDVTPEATLAVAHKVLPGFGEQMRQVSLKYVPTAILSRQVGVIRGGALILNLPGQPKAIKETLDGVFPAVPYCIDLIGGPYIETHDEVCKVFRPKSALRAAARRDARRERWPPTTPTSRRRYEGRNLYLSRSRAAATPSSASGAAWSHGAACRVGRRTRQRRDFRRWRRAPIVSRPSFERTIASAIASTRSDSIPPGTRSDAWR